MKPHYINSKFKMQRVWSDKWRYAIVENEMVEIVKFALQHVEFDQDWYLDKYRDVADAITAGEFSNARDHFVNHGYYEGRLPYRIPVDEKFYLDKYPDINTAIENGDFESASDHFSSHGFHEGRLPHRDFTLFRVYPPESQAV